MDPSSAGAGGDAQKRRVCYFYDPPREDDPRAARPLWPPRPRQDAGAPPAPRSRPRPLPLPLRRLRRHLRAVTPETQSTAALQQLCVLHDRLLLLLHRRCSSRGVVTMVAAVVVFLFSSFMVQQWRGYVRLRSWAEGGSAGARMR